MAELLALFQEGRWLLDFIGFLLMAILLLAVCIGFGSRILKEKQWDFCLGVGLIGLGTALLPLTALGALKAAFILLPLGLFFLWRNFHEIIWFRKDSWFWVWCALFGLLQFLFFLPQIDTDALYYHLAIPKQIWIQNGLVGGELKPNGSRPLPFHLLLSLLFGWGGFRAMLSFCSLLLLGLMLSLGERFLSTVTSAQSSRWIMLYLCLGSYSFWEQATIVANNVVVGFLLWLAWCVGENKQMQRGVFGVFLAGAVAIKLTAVGVGFAIWFLARKPWREKIIEAGIGAPLVIVWWIRNLLVGDHFLFPYQGWELEIPFLYLEKYGLGRDFEAMALLPWNIIMRANIDSLQFLGQLSPVFLLSPFLIWYWIRQRDWRGAFVILFGFGFWMAGPHWIRHLFPMFFVFVFMFSASIPWHSWFVRGIFFFLFFLGAERNILPFIDKTVHRMEERERLIPGYRAMQWLNEHTSQQDRIALFFAWSGSELDREFVLGSVEDHTPIRHWFMKHGDQAIVKLKEQEVKYIVVGPHRFLPKAYPFLKKDRFEAQFLQPVQKMEALLLRDTRLLVQLDGYRIYKINPE